MDAPVMTEGGVSVKIYSGNVIISREEYEELQKKSPEYIVKLMDVDMVLSGAIDELKDNLKKTMEAHNQLAMAFLSLQDKHNGLVVKLQEDMDKIDERLDELEDPR